MQSQLVHFARQLHFLTKLGATHEKSFQQTAGSMTEDEYLNMMIGSGRSVEGNRFIGEDGSAQAHRQPQGTSTAGRRL